MFWKRVRKVVDGLKFKAALGFGALLAASAALCWFSSAKLLDRELRKDLDRRISDDLERLNRTYITGRERSQRGRLVQELSIDPDELYAVQEKFPEGELAYIFERRTRNTGVRFFYVIQENQVYQARLNTDGTVYSRLIPLEDRIAAVKADFSSRVRGEGERRLRLRLRNSNGKLIAAAPAPRGSPRKRSDADLVTGSLPLFDGSRLEVARSTGELEDLRTEFQNFQGTVFVALLCIVLPCGWFITQRLLSGVGKVSAAAQRIAANGDFKCRVPYSGGGTEIRELVNAFNTMNDHNQLLFNEVRSVTDNIAHELKTPLTRLRSAAEVAVSGTGSTDGELAAVVSEECSEMLGLINSMLEITRTESGLIALARERVDLADMLRRARELFLPLAEDLGIELVIEDAAAPPPITADRVKLQRVFANLIDNALKFSDRGGKVTITLDSDDDSVQVSVADSGCGIAENELPHIFERLYRCDASRSRPGSGLGLALAAAIVRAHGGRIDVRSAPGKGSVFTVALPKNPEGGS